MKKPKQRIIYDNYNLDAYWKDAKSWLQETGNENPSDEEIWNEIYHEDKLNREEEYDRLKEIFDNGNFLAVGTCGLWHGNYDGGFVFDSFKELMGWLEDCEYIKFWDENGHFFVRASHHDGTHRLEIKQLTSRGKEYHDNWNYNWDDKRTEREVHAKLFDDSHYTHLIHYMHKTYGCPKRESEGKV